jgi:hypothetical protein
LISVLDYTATQGIDKHENDDKLPPNARRISRRERAAQVSVKIAPISRAKRSGCMRMFGRSRALCLLA